MNREGEDIRLPSGRNQVKRERKGKTMNGNQTKAAKAKFVYVTYIETTPEKIWGALTVDREVTRRYFLHEHFSDWKPGSGWEHRRADGSGAVDILGKVVESVPPRRLVLTWVRPFEADNADKYSRVTFDIDPQGTVVCLTVTHEDLEAGSEFHMGMVAGWPKVLSNLKTLLETGRTLNLSWGDLKRVGRWEE
jgi:uncharacterized protein YndB with AHSA1/START domain